MQLPQQEYEGKDSYILDLDTRQREVVKKLPKIIKNWVPMGTKYEKEDQE
jgi:hypothetical protein